MSINTEINQVVYIINRLLELSENLELCNKVNYKTRVSSLYSYNTVKENIYTVTLTNKLFVVNCLVRRPGSYHDLLSKLHKEVVHNPEYIGIPKDEIEKSLEVFASTLKGLKKKRQRFVYRLDAQSEPGVEEVVKAMPTWVVKDLLTSVLPELSKHFKDTQRTNAMDHGNLKEMLSDLDEVEGYLLLNSIVVEPFLRNAQCLLLEMPVDVDSEPETEEKD